MSKPAETQFPLAAADAFFGIFGMRRVAAEPILCAWCLRSLADADHTACRRMAGGGS